MSDSLNLADSSCLSPAVFHICVACTPLLLSYMRALQIQCTAHEIIVPRASRIDSFWLTSTLPKRAKTQPHPLFAFAVAVSSAHPSDKAYPTNQAAAVPTVPLLSIGSKLKVPDFPYGGCHLQLKLLPFAPIPTVPVIGKRFRWTWNHVCCRRGRTYAG